MTYLLTLLAATDVLTGPRVHNPAEPVEGVRAHIPDYVETTTTPLWENPMFILALALIGIVVIFALALFVGMWLTRRSLSQRHRDIERLMQEQQTIMNNDLFDAAAEITKISAMHNLHNRRRR